MQSMLHKMNEKTAALILGGGRGTRLFPLTLFRSKPAISVGGEYRLIDIPISNCINSGIGKIYVLTQFLSAGLNRHITRTYRFDSFGGKFVEILAAEQTPTNFDYAQGTADAVRQSIRYIENLDADYIFILSGDQLFRIDLQDMLSEHIQKNADVSVSCLPVHETDVERFGIMKINTDHRITDFFEKPGDPIVVESLRIKDLTVEGKEFIGSMGLYIFNKQVLLDLLRKSDAKDFGKGIFPEAIKTHHIHGYVFNGYWEDIGTIQSYFETNLALTDEQPPFSFYDGDMPIYTHPRHLPPAKVFSSTIDHGLISDGAIIKASHIKRCVIGIRSFINHYCDLEETLVLGNDAYYDEYSSTANENKNGHRFGIGENCVIKRAIIDKNAVIGNNVTLIGSTRDYINVKNDDDSSYHIINGIIVIPRGMEIPDNTCIKADDFVQ